jgi:N6-adenosine-specific RNA methylase IME4
MHDRATYGKAKPQRHYQTMTLDAIAALPVPDLAAERAHLWLWGINRSLGDAYALARGWGFEPMTLLTWCKTGAPGVGYYLRNSTEHCLLATRGEPMVPAAALPTSWYVWPKRRHSVKPHEFFTLVEGISPAPRLEMFARTIRPGWDSWGYDDDVAGAWLVDTHQGTG